MSIKKIISILSIFLMMGIAFTTINGNAHRPIHLDFMYETDSTSDQYQILKVTIIHGVTDPTIHYINNIERLN